jgi:hypothetical protein
LKSQEGVCKIKYGFEVPGGSMQNKVRDTPSWDFKPVLYFTYSLLGLQTRTLFYILPPGTSNPYINLHTPSWNFRSVHYFTYSLLGCPRREYAK